jgi:Tol biopolymer transport system component
MLTLTKYHRPRRYHPPLTPPSQKAKFPRWTRDGKEILFVSNKGHIYGTGGFWRILQRMPPNPGDPAPPGNANGQSDGKGHNG